jgi:hypothetical protein
VSINPRIDFASISISAIWARGKKSNGFEHVHLRAGVRQSDKTTFDILKIPDQDGRPITVKRVDLSIPKTDQFVRLESVFSSGRRQTISARPKTST